MKEKTLSFEKAFDRLEEILQSINENKAPLNDSIKLFEEADQLISQCNENLTSAEKKIETLIKNRNQEIELDSNSQPKTEEFIAPSQNKLL